MEEILASIRRIISEDETPAAAEADAGEPALEVAPDPEPPAPPAMAAPAEVEPAEEDEVLELTDRVDAAPEPTESHGDIDVYPVEAEPEPPPPPRAPEPRAGDEEPLVGRGAAESAASSFGQLAQSLAMPRDGRTLEDVVRELLRPLLKAWLDEHLPGIVQAKVEAEVERIARGGRGH